MPHKVYAFGSNNSGQLGLGHHDDVSVPTRCIVGDTAFNSRPCKLAAGGNHTLILCDDGSLYATGQNDNGRCALRGLCNMNTFHQVQFRGDDSEIISRFGFCAATWEATTLVTLKGEVFTCGTGRKGELGQGHGVETSNELKRILDFPPPDTNIVDLAACMSHTVVVLSNGELYGWGAGRKGQLGSCMRDAWTPQKIDTAAFSALRAVCGREFTYAVASEPQPNHIILGSDKFGVKSSMSELPCEWLDISANWGSIQVLLSSGRILAWGRNDHSQLASDTALLEELRSGSEHSIARSRSGTILAWGWGEHGNCGRATSNRENIIEAPQATTLLGAGCATSFLMCKDFHGADV